MERIILNVEGMSCAHCERAVKNAVGQLDGVERVIVDLTGKTVAIEYEPGKLTFESFKTVIEEEGYHVSGKI
ncbi:cation transporter [Acetobacterium wieringae]|uniref:Heavy-metal-associated domain-containing protein n=1 Tax=Acetobacterium wieringae TaxID=52694 RepID=A0A5D0WW56_9FIRM|nr:cation transporter [Acetobacterium wieringae]TYC88196.1 heavy-metal-associated domain-containing protein [Acetobacterium wieringae]URN83197.1 cation transporter [Acetobacterium wieringae]